MQKNVASQKIIVYAFDSTTNLPKTGDAANITAYISKDFGAVTVLGDTTATEEDATNAKGYYLFDVTQTETNADVVRVSAKSSTANIVVIGAPATIFTTPANFTADSIDSNGRRDVIKVAGTTQTAKDIGGAVPAAAAGASGGLLIAGANAGTTTFAALTVTGAFTISDGLLVSRSTTNASGATFTGNGTGSGAVFTSGSGATGDGVQMTAGSTAGNGLKLTKAGSGSDLNATVTPLVLAKTANITGFNDVAAGAAMTLTAAYDLAKTASQAGDIMKVSTGTGANQLDVTSGIIKANLAQILGTALTETAGQIAAAFKQFFNIASPTSTMNVITSVTTTTTATNLTTNNDKTGYALSSAGIQAIYDFAVSLITTAASFGKLVVDNLDAKISTRSTLGGTAQTGDAYGLLNSAQAEPSSVPAANASPVAKIGYVFAKMRNKRLTTATSDVLRNDGDSAAIATSTLADDGTTFSRTKDV